MSNKNVSSQSSIFNFFHPIISMNESKEIDISQKSSKKRVQKDVINNNDEYKKLENELAPVKKIYPPKTGGEKIKMTDSNKDLEYLINNENIDTKLI